MKKLVFLLLVGLTLATSVYAQYVQKTDLPTIYIETFDGYGITSKEVYKYCRMHYVNEDGQVTDYDSVSIRGRGNSTWNMAKKPYKIKFLNKEKFLGTGYAKAKKWTLLANAADKTMMRNAVTFALGEFTSLKFNPAAKFVDVVLNNSYIGTYQISDQIDVRAHRVNITEQNYPLGADDNITGGYLLEVDGFRDGNWFSTATYNAPVRIHYPEDEEIVERQTIFIKNQVNAFERALSDANFTDSLKGYRAYVDTLSLIDWYLCTEVSANIDGFYSTYFYKDQANPRFYWGPLWDYDIAYNNDYRVSREQGLSSSVHSLMVDIAYSGSREWVRRMWEDPWFQKRVYHRFKELVDAGLVSYMLQKVDSLQNLLSQSQQLNYQRWGISTRMYHETVLYSSYDQYVADLKDFITERCAYLEQAFYSKKPLEPTPPFVPGDYYYHIVNVKTSKAMDVNGTAVVQFADSRTRESEDWMIRPVGAHFQIVNRANEQALNDPTTGSVGPAVNVGAHLNVVTPDEDDSRQLWNLLPQGTDGYYNLENVYSQHVANLEGGRSDDNTAILSYTSDSRNGSSTNRLWRIVANGSLPDAVLGIEHPEPDEYALAYDPQRQWLHFGSATPEALSFPVSVFALNGMRVATFTASEGCSMADQPQGIYVITWKTGRNVRSVKFRK
ncbi:MAG: CotH kinase family protein [Prevotella sp.]|nr:CotH kinase family protein [Prevotella sp.]